MTIEASLQQTVLSEISSETIFLTMNSSGGFLNTAVILFVAVWWENVDKSKTHLESLQSKLDTVWLQS